jgi:hypothetical protein
MSQSTVVKLIKTLSSSEKRYFKLHCRKQSGNKDYIGLFDIIDQMKTANSDSFKEKFRETFPAASLDNTARYLLKILTDCLIQSKIEKDVFFESMQGIMRARILQERSMSQEGYRELRKIRELATKFQQPVIEYLTYRYELNYFAESNFHQLSDEVLIKTQMQAKSVIKNINQIHDHYSLFELLKYRLIHSGKLSSDDDREKLNDLMLSEMVLLTDKTKKSFSAQKLHLLFQSFFFTDIGDDQSALKIFKQLNNLFEENPQLHDHPPLDYLSSLSGILDSLHMQKNYKEISFYINKLKPLDEPEYPEYFRYLVRKTIAMYNLVVFIGRGNFQEAIDYIHSFESNLLTAYNMIEEERQWELYFYCSLAFFCKKDFKKAHKYISEVMRDQKMHSYHVISKAIRLLNIIIHFEKGDIEYLKYEIRSYKRFFSRQNKLLRAETIILKFIENLPIQKVRKQVRPDHVKLAEQISLLKKDKYENQLLKYFDFTGWLVNLS